MGGGIGDRAFDGLLEGQLVYNKPETMTVGQPEDIQVMIADNTRAEVTARLQTDLIGSGVPMSDAIKVSLYMAVNLRSQVPDDFEIISHAERIQKVRADDEALWLWTVTPLRVSANPQRLYIESYAVLPHEGGNEERPRPPEVITVTVQVASAPALNNEDGTRRSSTADPAPSGPMFGASSTANSAPPGPTFRASSTADSARAAPTFRANNTVDPVPSAPMPRRSLSPILALALLLVLASAAIMWHRVKRAAQTSIYASVLTPTTSPLPQATPQLKDDPHATAWAWTGMDRTQMRFILSNHFSFSELQELCFELNIDIEDLSGSTRADKVLSLIHYIERHTRVADLVAIVRRQRPKVFQLPNPHSPDSPPN